MNVNIRLHYYTNLTINNNYARVSLVIINIEKMFPYVAEGEKSACFLSAA